MRIGNICLGCGCWFSVQGLIDGNHSKCSYCQLAGRSDLPVSVLKYAPDVERYSINDYRIKTKVWRSIIDTPVVFLKRHSLGIMGGDCFWMSSTTPRMGLVRRSRLFVHRFLHTQLLGMTSMQWALTVRATRVLSRQSLYVGMTLVFEDYDERLMEGIAAWLNTVGFRAIRLDFDDSWEEFDGRNFRKLQ